MSVSCETLAKTDKETFQNERFIRDIRKNRQRDLPKWAFRTRHSQKLTKRYSKMSVSCETFAKTDKKISRKSSKMSVSYEAFAKTKISVFQCPNGTAYISHIRHIRSPQRVDHAQRVTQFRLGFAHPTRTISAKGCTRNRTNAVSSRFRASDTHDLRKGLITHPHKHSLAQVSRIRHARSPQRVDHATAQTQFRLGFAHPTRMISAKVDHAPAQTHFRASDTHDLCKGLTTQTHKRNFV